MKTIKKFRVIICVLFISLFMQSVCYAGSWNSIGIPSGQSVSFTTSSFYCNGRINLQCALYSYSVATINQCHIQIQQKLSNQWIPVKDDFQYLYSLNTTELNKSYSLSQGAGTYRLVITTTSVVNLYSGNVIYYTE